MRSNVLLRSRDLLIPLIVFTIILSIANLTSAQASVPQRNPIDRLKNGFFPKYLAAALNSYLKKDLTGCFENLQHLEITSFTNEPEKYYLLKALCAPKEKQPLAATEYIALALKEKGSSSDIIYAASIVLSQIEANDEALKHYQDAIWFNRFKVFDEKDFYFDYGSLQYKLAMLGEAKDSLEKAQTLGTKGNDLTFMLADIARRRGDRKNAILLARQLSAARADNDSEETLLLALMVSADPVFHKREIAEAAELSKRLKDSSFLKADLGVAATKALLLVNEKELAEVRLKTCLAVNPADARLQALDLQIKEEKTSGLGN